ncbi:pseudouridine synthase [Kosmotoga pacifica]|uniref:Pseudouridine synthase n=1 Tax=Kosmotoga pacifica TaxID=1330330 RepID=A0A0G2Z9V0_9BACT|nr:pseudouridine synthase [Kosmotoga pacifica]
MKEKLQRFLQRNTNLSRRKAGEVIKAGRVKVDDRIVTDPWLEIDHFSKVFLDGKKVVPQKIEKVVYALNKPVGVLTAMKDDRGRPTITDLITGKIKEKVFHVGRLDKDTEGLLLLTNDGEFANEIAHPSSEIKKTYVAVIAGKLSIKDIKRLEEGIILQDGFKTSGAEVRVLNEMGRKTVVELKIHEGHKREVREMFRAIHKKVLALKRTAIGGLKLDVVPKPGMIKKLGKRELSLIKNGDR